MHPPIKPRRRTSPVANAFSYLFVGVWSLWYWAQSALIAPVATVVLVIFALIEISGSFLHIMPQYEHQVIDFLVGFAPWAGVWIRVAFSFLLASAVAGLIYHHWRLDIQINRINIVLSSMGALLDEQSMREPGGAGEERITAILDALVFSVMKHSMTRGRVNATVLSQPRPGEKFVVAYQDSENAFESTTQLDPYRSAAANLTQPEFECGTLLYVPNSGYRHGIRIFSLPTTSSRARTSPRKTWRAFEVVPNAFQTLDEQNQKRVRSLLCVQVPLGHGDDRRGPSGEFAVICLSSNRHGRMRDLEFAALKHGAAFVSFALTESITAQTPSSESGKEHES